MMEPTGPTMSPTASPTFAGEIPKYVNEILGAPPVYLPTVVKDYDGKVVQHEYEITMMETKQQILPPGYPDTLVWGYGGIVEGGAFSVGTPSATVEAEKGVPVKVKWVVDIKEHIFAVDPTVSWANPNNLPNDPTLDYPLEPPYYEPAQSPVPFVVHVHGGEQQAASDGFCNSWWTIDGTTGVTYLSYEDTDANAAVYFYPNEQEAGTLWYHDHALGMTRLNVYAGLAGFYLLRDPEDKVARTLPSGKYEVPLAFQDKTFNADGSLFYPVDGNNPSVHPYWTPEFFGEVIMVNGLAWPNMNVEPTAYRFRVLDASNARFYTISLSNGLPFTVIGKDDGYIRAAVPVFELTIAPGERFDLLVDFSGVAPGTQIIMLNSANGPFPDGDPVAPGTTDQVMQFTVTEFAGKPPKVRPLPTLLNPPLDVYPSLHSPTNDVVRVLNEVDGPTDGPTEALLDRFGWTSPTSEFSTLGTTEDWYLVDATVDSHPIHFHLVQFQLVSRQPFNATEYLAAWQALPDNEQEPLDAYYTGPAVGPTPLEEAWYDVIQVNPGEVTRIRIKWAPTVAPAFAFDATEGLYMWHCHILEHEDNEMMRPYSLMPDL